MNTVDASLLERLNQTIDQHIDQSDYSIDELCAELGLSRSGLFRLIKQQTGFSTTLYIRHRRLLRARLLLETTALRVAEIADQTGFSTSQDLSRYFAETFGCSPSEYRKQSAESSAQLSRVAEPVAEPVPPSGGGAGPAPLPPAEPSVAATPRRRLTAMQIAGASGLLLVLLALIGWYVGRHVGTDQPAQPVALAVLPFQNTGDAQSQYFSDGVMEQTHQLLTLVEGLKVISRTSTAQYAQTRKSPAQIAGELGVTYLLTGQVRQWNNQVRLSVELVLAAENQTLWSHTYEGPAKDIFRFISGTARAVADALNQQLSQTTAQRLTQPPTHNHDAYTEYLKGQYLLLPRTEAGLTGSLVNFDRAIALDSTFADAYAAKALVHFLFIAEGYGPSDPHQKPAETNALTAIRLNPRNGMAYAVLANLYRVQNKWEQAVTTYQIALRYAPNDAQINYWYSITLRSLGQVDEAVRYSTNALGLDPLHPVILIGHIGNLTYANRFAEARQAIAEGSRLHSQVASWYWATGYYYLYQQQYAKAYAEFAKCRQLNHDTDVYPAMMAYCSARLGRPQEARALLDSLPYVPDQYAHRAMVYAGLGNADSCLTYLERGAETGRLPNYLKVSVLFRFLHRQPRFQAVLRQVGLETDNLTK
ncbi:hypothetical protein GCM10023189_56420 [Nibrella saemangeumensis]|uniref:HTH araC/xylS-type domain-containing protein n=1 Tax=Nibrella saemangeumensis TaxID=1084526 RepID=A0ABP8NPZ2_9BACT